MKVKNLSLIPLFILLAFVSFLAIAEDDEKKKEPKIYTQSQYDQKLRKEVSEKVNKLKKVNIATLINELLDKEEKIKVREQELEKRYQALDTQSANLIKEIKKFESQKQQILGCIDKNDEDANNRVIQMVQVFSNMRPAKAAEVLSVQESDLAVKVLSQMDAVKVSKIFNVMKKEVSARLQKQYMNMKR